jgi:hypothetical protein
MQCTTSKSVTPNGGPILFMLLDIVQYSWGSWDIGEESWYSVTCRNISSLCKRQAALITDINRNEQERRGIDTQKAGYNLLQIFTG